MKKLITLSMIALTVLFTGCDETKKVIDVAGNVQLTGSYTVTALKGQKVSGQDVPTFSLSAVDNSIQGNTGCNSIFGKYTLDLYTINFKDIAVTSRECAEDNTMDLERKFLDALNDTGSFELQENSLTLYSKIDRSVLLKATKDKKK